MEFDKNKILTCVTGSSALIGKKGWFGDSIVELARKYRDNKPHMLQAFDSSSVYPFKSEGGYGPSTLFYPAPEPTYRPFNDDELNDLVGKVVIQKHTGNAMLVIKVVDGETGKMVSLGGSQKRNAQQLLEGWTFKDGHPCGVKEES